MAKKPNRVISEQQKEQDMVTQNLKRKKNNNLKDQKRTRASKDPAIITPLSDKQTSNRAEEALHSVHEELEIRVQERTTELMSVVEALQDEMAERKRVEGVLRKSEETAKRLAQENAIMAEIGRIISSTLNIEEVYERFAEEVHELIPFDGIAINIINHKEGTVIVPYVSGIVVPGCQSGDVLPLAGSVTGEVMRTHSGLIIQTEDKNELQARFPTLLTAFETGLRSVIVVPLISKDQVIGAIHFRSSKPYAYSDQDLKLAESIASQITGAIANAQLFIERKRSEEALRKSEGKYRELTDFLPETIFECDENGKLLFTNRYGFEVFGYTQEDFNKGLNIFQMIIPEDRGKAKQNIQRLFREEKLFGTEYTGLRKDGSTFPAIISSNLIFREHRPAGLRGIVIDITERKRAEASRRESEERYRTILENIEDGYYEVDLPGNFTFFNDPVCRLYGFSKDELMGMNDRQYTDKENAKKLYQTFNKVYKTGEPTKGFDWEIIRKDGTKRYIEASVSLVKNPSGQPIGFRGIVRDITERKQAEEGLKDSEERYRKLFENAIDGIVLADLERGIIIDCNKVIGGLVEREKTELIGQSQQILHPPEDSIGEVSRTFAQHRFDKEGQVLETQVITKTGEIKQVEIKANILELKGRKVLQGIFRDITERKNNDEKILRQSTLLDGVNKVLIGALICQTEGEIANKCLNVAQALTKSKFGFIGEINQAGRFDTLAMSDPGWEACRIPRSDSVLLINNMEMRGIWASVLKEERSLIVNDPAAHPNRVGTPEGHPLLTSFLGVPLKHMRKTIGMIALANKETGYDSIDQNDIETLCTIFVEALMRNRAEEALRESKTNLVGIIESTADGIMAVDNQGKVITSNSRFAQLWRIPQEILERGDDDTLLAFVLDQLVDPEAFLTKVRALYNSDKENNDVILFNDGRVFERYSRPLMLKGSITGRVWSFRDVTERRNMEQRLESELSKFKVLYDLAVNMSAEKNLNENLSYIVEQSRNLLHADTSYIALADEQCQEVYMRTLSGIRTEAFKKMRLPFGKGLGGKVMTTRKGYIIEDYYQDGGITHIVDQVVTDEGVVAGMAVPLQIREKSLGVLYVFNRTKTQFKQEDLDTLFLLGNLAAVEIDSQQAQQAVRESERTSKRFAQENGILAEIGRIISSSLNIDEVYERLAEEVRKLIPFDRIVININNFGNNTITIAYASGIEVPGRRVGNVIPLNGSVNQEIIHTRSSLLIQSEDMAEFINRFPTLRPYLQVGLVSMMMIPLISKDQVIGVLHFRSIKQNTYTEKHMKLAERVSSQIASAIANAQLFNERKKIERALQESESRFKNLFDEAPVGYHEYNTEGLITQVNRTELEMLGYTAEEMLGQPVWQFITEIGKSREAVIAKLSGEIPPGRQFERSCQRKDGTTFPALIEDRFLRDSQGKIAGVRSTIQDITDRKRAEEEMRALEEQFRQSQKMEAIGRLGGGIAHDFNNLLTIIKGYSQLSLLDLKENDPLWGNIQEIQKATQRATDLTHQLLAFSRRQILDLKVLDLNTLLKDLDKMLRRIIGEDIELTTLLAKNLGRVKIDPGQFEQIILNVAVNARDAMPSGGKLTIETANVVLDEEYARTHVSVTPGPYVRLSVSDTGVGIPLEVKEKVFEPFFTTKEKGKGTGLGLSTVYGIVKQSGGNIWVYSELTHGTTFKIYLPRVEEDLDTLHGRDETDFLPSGSETVLLVEDEPSVRDLAHRLLNQQGYKVLEAANGEEALRVVQEHIGEKIHLLLTDVVMPQMGGKELANQLKNLRPDVKVLFTSGYTDDAIVHHGVLEPGTHFLQKPFSPKTLTHKVREALDR
jgi:two-component system, cell cycle sensor histidine kinase and response regulator CckA